MIEADIRETSRAIVRRLLDLRDDSYLTGYSFEVEVVAAAIQAERDEMRNWHEDRVKGLKADLGEVCAKIERMDSELDHAFDDGTNAVCQAMQEQDMCKCEDGKCLALKVSVARAARKEPT